MQLFALGLVAKHCFVSFLLGCWAALGFSIKVESVRVTSGDFPGVDSVSVSGIINA